MKMYLIRVWCLGYIYENSKKFQIIMQSSGTDKLDEDILLVEDIIIFENCIFIIYFVII